MKKHILAALLVVSIAAWCVGQSNFTMGEDMFMYNEPEEAVGYLESAVAEDPAHVQAFLYLGIVYEQLDRTSDAIGVYQQILAQAGDLTANVANNLGNMYFKAGNDADAEASYTQALEADAAYASAYLGRANTRLKTGAIQDAAADYEQYLNLEPDAPQREAIQQLLVAVRADLAEAAAAAAAARLAAGENTETTELTAPYLNENLSGSEDDHE